MKNIILDLSGACSEEGLDRLLPDAEKLDLTSIEGTNCYCDEAAAAAIRSAIAELPAAALHWDDTGDYHYLSRFWLEKASSDNGGEPFAMVLFDVPGLSQVLLVGINPDLEIEILDLVFDGVLAVTTDDLRHTGDVLSQDVLEMFSLLEPGIPVYISVDKDVLTKDFARTDWDQGCMTLAQLEAAVLRAAAGHRLLGADICGGLTRAKGATDADLSLNLSTDSALAKLFGNLIID